MNHHRGLRLEVVATADRSATPQQSPSEQAVGAAAAQHATKV